MREREKGRTQEQAAASANVRSRKTVAKYEKLGQFSSELVKPRRQKQLFGTHQLDRAQGQGAD